MMINMGKKTKKAKPIAPIAKSAPISGNHTPPVMKKREKTASILPASFHLLPANQENVKKALAEHGICKLQVVDDDEMIVVDDDVDADDKFHSTFLENNVLNASVSDAKKPSEVTDRYWLYAHRKKGTYPEATSNNGKWLIFVKKDEIDGVWSKVRDAVEDGRLGSNAKVSTMKPNPNAQDPDTKVICVYTYDWTDVADVMHVRDELRKMGITWKCPYKSDQDTIEGKYRISGHTRISKYY